MRIGLIWMTNLVTGITWHNGATAGYHAYIAFDRSSRHGVVLLSNVQAESIDLLALRVLIPDIAVPLPVVEKP